MRIATLALIAAIGFISGGDAKALVYVDDDAATFQWASASGPVEGYVVVVSRNGGPFTFAAVTGPYDRRFTIPAQTGEQIQIQVAAYDASATGLGPLSNKSEVVAFVDRRPRASIPGLYDTGVHNDGKAQGSFRDELHYGYSGPTAGASTLPTRPLWADPPPGSSWIGPDAQFGAPGTYVYTLNFNLGNLDAKTAFLTGYWAADDGCEIRLNGASTGINVSSGGYPNLRLFVINSGFVQGTNRLEFIVRNGSNSPNPTGLLVSNLSGTAEIAWTP